MASRRNSIKSKANARKSIYSTVETKESKEIKEKDKKEVKVLGDIGYTFSAQNKKEKELQFQTNRLGKDFDKLLNEIREFKRVIKEKINTQNTEDMNKLNTFKDIFLLDNKANMKYAVDKIINKTNETFDPIKYQKKVDAEKQLELNEVIDKKIDEYNNNMDKIIYERKINNERQRMIHDNIINKYQYRQYRNKLNNQVFSLPNIYIEPTKIVNRQQKKTSDKDKTNGRDGDQSGGKDSKYKSKKGKSAYVNDISEETVHDFGTTLQGNDQYRTKIKREINPRSETYIELPDIIKNKNNSKIIPSNKSIKKEEEGKEQLMKAIIAKEVKEQISQIPSKKTGEKIKKTSKKTVEKSKKTSKKTGEKSKKTSKKEEEEEKEEEEKEEEDKKEEEEEKKEE